MSWADAEQLFADGAPAGAIDIRNAAGRVIAICRPVVEPDVVIEVTSEEEARRPR